MEFLTTVAPGIAALLLAIAGIISQRVKDKQRDKVAVEVQQKADRATEKTEKTALTMQETLSMYEFHLRELRSENQDLTEKVDKAEHRARENSGLIHGLNEKINACEHKSADLEDRVRVLQVTLATRNTQLTALTLELENLTSAIKARGVKSALEITNS